MSEDILEDYITRKELAAEFGKSPRTLERWVRLRLLPEPVRIGHEILFPKSALKEFLARKSNAA